MNTTTTPLLSPIAALRRMRRAAWQTLPPGSITEAHEALVQPLGDLHHTWHRVSRAHEAYLARPTADTWAALATALDAFDAALMPLFGPSGWERT